jgi:hypothetical protein
VLLSLLEKPTMMAPGSPQSENSPLKQTRETVIDMQRSITLTSCFYGISSRVWVPLTWAISEESKKKHYSGHGGKLNKYQVFSNPSAWVWCSEGLFRAPPTHWRFFMQISFLSLSALVFKLVSQGRDLEDSEGRTLQTTLYKGTYTLIWGLMPFIKSTAS